MRHCFHNDSRVSSGDVGCARSRRKYVSTSVILYTATIYSGCSADAVPASDALDDEAIAEAVPVRVGDETTRVFTPEHAVAIALRTWRGKDREHIDRLIRTGLRPLDVDRLQASWRDTGLGRNDGGSRTPTTTCRRTASSS